MADSKHTKRALLGSALALVLCFAMLLGTTFAWFTDTAKTTVNKIESGTLDIEIVDEDGNKLTGPIKWKAKDKYGNPRDNILWEPGATYGTEEFYLINKGSLALKYKVYIDGFTGDTKLLDKLTFSVLLYGDTLVGSSPQIITLDRNNEYSFEGHLLPASEGIKTDTIETDPELVQIEFRAMMDPSADDDYQGLSLDGVTIKVVATQYGYEADRLYNKTKDIFYDDDASYPEYTDPTDTTP